jgi:hypothetical protein
LDIKGGGMNLKTTAATIGALTVIVTTALAIESHYAKEIELAGLAQQFRQYQIDQSDTSLQEKIWQTEDRIKVKSTPELEQRLRELKFEQDKLKKQREQLKDK